MLYNPNIATYLLGCLMKNTELLFNLNYPLSKYDFAPIPLHYVLFVVIVNLAKQGVHEVQPEEVDNFCAAFPAQLEILNDGNFIEFIATAKELSLIDNYEYYYNIIRKFSLLRKLQDNNIGVNEFYDELHESASQIESLDKISIQDILNKTEAKISALRTSYDINYTRDEMWAGEDTENLLDFFKQKPAFGALLSSGYLTTLYQGWCRGHLLLRSGSSGTGKTRLAVNDLCNVGVQEVWSNECSDFISNPNYQGPSFFIHTEMKTRNEINPLFLACVSGVNYRDIVNGNLSDHENKRVLKAGEILIQSQLKITDMPDFTIQSIERKIKENVENYGAAYGVFDYVQLQSSISTEFKSNNTLPPREDLVLKSVITELKSIAEKYNVGIMSMTQLNDNWKSSQFPDESCLSGSKAMKNKIDSGSIVLSTKDRLIDFKEIEPMLHLKGLGTDNQIKPNIIEFVYKARYGLFADQKIKIWSYFDRGTMRRIDFFCTDANNLRIKVEQTLAT